MSYNYLDICIAPPKSDRKVICTAPSNVVGTSMKTEPAMASEGKGEWLDTRPGKLTKNYGKSPFLMGKLTIRWPFSIAMLVITRG